VDASKLPLIAYARRLSEKAAERRSANAASHVTLNEGVDIDSDDEDDEGSDVRLLSVSLSLHSLCDLASLTSIAVVTTAMMC
jgi:RNA 3'-terminal phosphate cyclase